MDLKSVIAHNRAVLARSRALNTRAGEVVFPVPSRDAFEASVRRVLDRARRGAEIRNLGALMLDELDPQVVELLMNENPDELPLLGRSFKVEYREGYAPRITLDQALVATHGWRELPEAGVKLPGGRSVELVVPFGYYDTVSSQNVPELKSLCASKANKSLWDNWPQAGRPEITLPDPADPASVVPEIIECPYGTSVVDGTPLVAYGVAKVNPSRWYSHEPHFLAEWRRSREEAETAREEAIVKLESARKEALEQKQLDDTRKAAEAARGELRSIRERTDWYELDHEIREELESRLYSGLSSDVEIINDWTKQALAIAAKANAWYQAKADAKAAAEARLVDLKQRGKLVCVLELSHDRHGEGWVINPDGTLRTADERDRWRTTWHNIGDELVIVAGVNRVSGVNGFADGGPFTCVIWRPEEVTEAQRATVRRIEAERKLEGAFAVDPIEVARQAARLDELHKEIVRVVPNTGREEIALVVVCGPNGLQTRHEDPQTLVNWGKPFTERCEGRDAQIVRAVRCADGMLEFLAYDKWGNTNLNARWRPLTEEEKATPKPAPVAAKPTNSAQINASLADLAAKFRKR